MKKHTIIALTAGTAIVGLATFLGARSGSAENFHEGCRIAGIEQGLNASITELKQSPAYGHASGHYKKAIEDIERTRKQIHEGCRAWMKDGKK
jgi:hypothetical protein